MNADESRRFEALKTPWCSAQFIKELYGLDLSVNEKLRNYFKRSKPEVIKEEKSQTRDMTYSVNRFYLETIMQANKLLPRKWMAAKIGMTEESLITIIENLTKKGLLYKHYIWPELIEQDFDDELVSLFPQLKFRTFGSYNSFCEAIQELLATLCDVKVEPLHCVTSEFLKDSPIDFAHAYDCITLKPISVKYQVWLDFNKPMYLAPDCCSLLFYAQEERDLAPFVAGISEPTIPDRLRQKASH